MADNLSNTARRGVAWTTVGSLGNYGVHFVFNIILARLLSPEDFGICFMPVIFYTLAHICVEGGFSSALVQRREVNERDYNTAYWFRQLMGVAMYAVLWLCAPLIASFYDTPVLTDVIKVSGLSLIIAPLTMIPHVRFMRQLNFRTPALLGIAGALMSGASGVTLALHGWGLWALVWSGIMTDLFNLLLLAFVAPWWPRLQFSLASMRAMLGFGSKMQASQILNTIIENLTPILIGKVYSGHQLGLYMRSLNWARIPSSGLTGVVGKVIFPLFSRLQDDTERLASAFRRVSRVTAFVIFPLMMAVAAISDPMVRVLLTDKWEECIPYTQLLCFSMMWYPILSINLQLLIAKGRSDAFLRLEVIKAVASLALLGAFYYGIMVYLWVMVLLSPVSLWVNAYYTKRLTGVSFRRQLADLLPIVLFAGVMYGLLSLVIGVIGNVFVQFVVSIVVGFVFYVVVGRWLFRREFDEVMRMLGRKR